MRALLLLLFFASGSVGLIYEVAWTRGLLLLLGSTAGATATVLGVFVAGLGLGARWGGAKAEASERPLRLYAVLEVGAGLWALLTLVLLGWLIQPYVAIAAHVPEAIRLALRIVIAVIIVFPAAFLLGATLPAMVRHWVRTVDRTGRTTAWLYGINTVGAVVGCMWTGFWGIELLGVPGVLMAASALGIVIGVAAALLAKQPTAAREPTPVAADGPRLPPTPAVAAALLCGFIGLGVEVAGFRVLVFFLEGFTVTFAAMLGIFIAGLGLGSLALGDVLARTDRPARLLGVMLLIEAAVLLLALLWVLPSFEGWMHKVKAGMYAGSSSEGEITAALRWASIAGAAILLFVPAFLLGPTFPLCVRWAERDGLPPAEAVGRSYVGNSAGSIIAPLLLTFAIMPWVGVLGGWLMLTVLTLVAGLGLLLIPEARLQRPATVVALTLVALLVGLLSPLPRFPGTRTSDLVEASVVMRGKHDFRHLIDSATDSVTTASVVETDDGEVLLYTDDFAAAATGRYDRYMRMLGHLPAVLAKDPKNAMVIAFGTGTTAGAVSVHEDVKRLEVVEVSQAVLDLAHHFGEANRGVLKDGRVEIVRDDGRNTLLLHESDLDLITLEPLMPYSPQGLPLYTREFYELAKSKLRDGGVLCQWVPVHAMRADLYAAFVRTFFEVFPEGTLWFFEQASVLIGWKGKGRPDQATIDRRVQAIQSDLYDAGFDDPWMFASGYLAHGQAVLDGPIPDGPFGRRSVIDGDPFPEFHPTPRANLNTQYLEHTLGWLESLVDPAFEPQGEAWWPASMHGRREGTRRALEARRYGARAHYESVFVASETVSTEQRRALVPQLLEDYDLAAQTFGKALGDIPADRVLRRRRLLNLRLGTMIRAAALMRRADTLAPGEAKALLRQADRLMRSVMPPMEQDPAPFATERERAAQLLATIQIRLGRCLRAEETLREAAAELGKLVAARRLAEYADKLAALDAGRPVDDVPVWMQAAMERGAPCRKPGLAPLRKDLAAFRRSLESGRPRLVLTHHISLEGAAHREDLVRELLAELEPEDGADAPDGLRVLVASLRLSRAPRTLTTPRDPLLALASQPKRSLRVAVLGMIKWRGWIDRYVRTSLMSLATSDDAAVRRAFVSACEKANDPTVVCLAVDALMDENADVRKEAVGVLFNRAADQLESYDPDASEAERRPIYEAVKQRLGCS